MVRIISDEEVISCLNMKDVISVVEDSYIALEKGNAIMPQRLIVLYPQMNSDCFFMPAILPHQKAFGVKVSPYFPNNPKDFGLPPILGFVALIDAKNGGLRAIMEDQTLTPMRTGATCAIASKYLARRDSSIVGLIGLGRQAEYQIRAICNVHDITRINATSRNPEKHQKKFESMANELGIDISICNKSKDVIKGADILLLATSSSNPVIKGEWLEPGVHVSSIFSGGPKTREVDLQTILISNCFADSKEACLREAGEFVMPINEGKLKKEDIKASLGELASGNKKGRESNEEITFFKSVGVAVADISTAMLVYNSAIEKSVGTDIPFHEI